MEGVQPCIRENTCISAFLYMHFSVCTEYGTPGCLEASTPALHVQNFVHARNPISKLGNVDPVLARRVR
jgi:hypothetical protein